MDSQYCHIPKKKCSLKRKKPTKNGQSETLYACTYQNCVKYFKIKKELNRHLKRIHPPGPRLCNFKCDICQKGFYTGYELDAHQNRTHSTLKPFGCTECERSFKSKLGLKVHISSHKGENSYACPHCPKVLSTLSNWRRHTYIHTKSDNTRKKLSCPHHDCSAKFEYPFELKRHISRVHGIVERSRDHKCSTCSAAFFDKYKLRRHQDIHTRDPATNLFVCYFCPKRKPELCQLVGHMRTHTREKPHRCPLCKGAFTFGGNLRRHIFTHTKEKPFPCSVCEMGFSSRQALRAHVATHTGEKRFFCKMCDYASFHRISLMTHVQRIHYRLKEFQCHVCPKRLFSKPELRLHVKGHFNGVVRREGAACYLCQVRFGVRDLQAHLRRCTGERNIQFVW
ncbi:zinc finger protein 728 [Folsomia candida]|uniref:zinc finger protein 728 n=1 Tax=Folsomia candida TaxID=158441 RepID=UPI000B905E90|nr:zinc finger protein 728 [Folsomia candida]